ncbi:hypothetical protein FIBSPDRAFT_969090 [Athelia psychrophila]|uniref:DUF4219 domain-containing protein n=1 Tax=Athelia psychrophila TaxID=1759441 RepID=A0A167TVS9_9AGAM|nr:hypothetical protein FIBSPDRAFT_969090 [Fibularhizoctonia sp. CBS 109695]
MASLSGLPTYPKLNESNYADWSVDTKALLQSQKLWRLVSGTQTKPTVSSSDATAKKTEQTALDDCEDRSERAYGIITLSLSPGQKTHISTTTADDPVAMWTALNVKLGNTIHVHEAQQPGNRYNAYDDLFSIKKQDDEALSALIMRTEQAVYLIKALRPATGFDIDKLDAELQCMALIHAC